MTYAAPSPVTYSAAAPVFTGGSTTVPAATSMVVPSGTTLTLMKGARVIYTSKTTGEEYAGSVVERNAAGWLLKLDVDGGVKEVVDAEMWRVKAEGGSIL